MLIIITTIHHPPSGGPSHSTEKVPPDSEAWQTDNEVYEPANDPCGEKNKNISWIVQERYAVEWDTRIDQRCGRREKRRAIVDLVNELERLLREARGTHATHLFRQIFISRQRSGSSANCEEFEPQIVREQIWRPRSRRLEMWGIDFCWPTGHKLIIRPIMDDLLLIATRVGGWQSCNIWWWCSQLTPI